MQRKHTHLQAASIEATLSCTLEPELDSSLLEQLYNQHQLFSTPPKVASHFNYRKNITTAQEHTVLKKWSELQPKQIVHIGLGGSVQGVKFLADNIEQTTPIKFVDVPEQNLLNKTIGAVGVNEQVILCVTKSGTTQETVTLLGWAQKLIDPSRIFVVTSNPEVFLERGIPLQNIVELDADISGRFSTLAPTSLAVKYQNNQYEQILAGAQAMDEHVLSAAASSNLAIQVAAFMYQAYPICHFSPFWLSFAELVPLVQQLHMESLGKQTQQGRPAGSIIFGEVGVRAAHSYFQYLHASGDTFNHIFISPKGDDESHRLAAIYAQSQFDVLADQGHKFIYIQALTNLHSIGALLSLFEHAAIIGALMTGVHPFTQPGVEKGKQRMRELLAQ